MVLLCDVRPREGEGSAHSGYCFATGHLAMSKDSTQWECYFAEGHRGMGEGSAHSEYYFATAYLARVEGSAHSGCYSTTEH